MSEQQVSKSQFDELTRIVANMEKRLSSAELEIIQHRMEIEVLCQHIRQTQGPELLNEILETTATHLEEEHAQNIDAHALASGSPEAYRQHWDERTRHLTRSIRERILK